MPLNDFIVCFQVLKRAQDFGLVWPDPLARTWGGSGHKTSRGGGSRWAGRGIL